MKRIFTSVLCLLVCLLLLASCTENALPAAPSEGASSAPEKADSSSPQEESIRPMPPEQEQEGSPDIPPLLAGDAASASTEYDASEYLRSKSHEESHLPMAVMKSREDIDTFLAACPDTAAVADFTKYDEAWFAERHLAVIYIGDSGSPQYLVEGETWSEKDGAPISTILIRYHQPMIVNENWIQFLMLIPLDATASRCAQVTNRILGGSVMYTHDGNNRETHYHNEPVDPVLKELPGAVTADTAAISLLRTQSLAELRPATATGDTAKEILGFFQSLAYDPDQVCACVVDSNWMEMGTIFSIDDTYYLYSGGGWFVRCEEGQVYLTRDQATYIIDLLYGVLNGGAEDYSLAHQTFELFEKGDTEWVTYTPEELKERWITGWNKAEITTPVLTLNSKADVTALLSEGKGNTFRDYLSGLTDADFAEKSLLLVEFTTPNCHRDYILKSMELRDGKLTLRFGCADTCEEEALGTWGALIWMHKPFAATLTEIEAAAEEYKVISLAFKGDTFRTSYVSATDDPAFAPIFEQALNADSIGYGRGKSSALFAFSTLEELQAFQTLADGLIREQYGSNSSFLSDPFLDDCDDAYFEDYTLFAVYLEVASGSYSCSADQILQGGNSLCFYVDVNSSGEGTCDMAGWFAVFTVPKSWLDDRLTYDAYWH